MESEKPKQLVTKSFLEEQIKVLQSTIERNIGVLNFCNHLLKEGIYVEEDKVSTNGHKPEATISEPGVKGV